MSDEYKIPILDFKNFDYFRVPKKNMKDFESFAKYIKQESKAKKKVPAESIAMFIGLLENIRKESFKIYWSSKIHLVNDVIDYLIYNKEHKRYKKQYDFKGFEIMIYQIVQDVLKIQMDKNEKLGKGECIMAGFRSIVDFRNKHMSPEQRKLYNSTFKLGAVSAIIADKVFKHDLSREYRNSMDNDNYFHSAWNEVKKYPKTEPELFAGLKPFKVK